MWVWTRFRRLASSASPDDCGTGQFCDTRAMRIVGTSRAGADDASVNPQEAWARGRVLDAMLPTPVMVPRGVSRLTHMQRNALDDARMVEVARRLNTPGNTSGAT